MQGRFDSLPKAGRTHTRRRVTIAILIISLLVFVLGLNGRQPASGAQKVAEGGAAQVMTILSMPVRGLESIFENISRHFELAQENETLRAEVARLRQIEDQGLALAEQVNYLEQVLNTEIIGPNLDTRIAARAVSENEGPFVRSALINAGLRKGVSDGDPVMTLNGLYGRIVRSGGRSSRALLLTDLNSRVAVMSQRSRARAILTGNNSASPTLEFRGQSDWQAGDRVVTSGDDGVLPRGLPVGIVNAADQSGLTVRLLTDKDPVDWVVITPFTPIAEPEIEAGAVIGDSASADTVADGAVTPDPQP